MNKIYMLAGGGIDTALLLYAAAMDMVPQDDQFDEIRLLHMDYGHLASNAESSAMWSIIESMKGVWPHLTVSMSRVCDDTVKLMNPCSLMFGGKGTAFLHGRNINLAVSAANHAMLRYTEGDTIELWFGLVMEKMMFADADHDWIRDVRKVIERSYGYLGSDEADERLQPRVTVRAPMLEVPHNQFFYKGEVDDSVARSAISKLDMLKSVGKALSDKVGMDKAMAMLFVLPFTCWTPKPNGLECGECYHCEKKKNLYIEVETALLEGTV